MAADDPLLDTGSKLVQPHWRGRVYPTAGEATGAWGGDPAAISRDRTPRCNVEDNAKRNGRRARAMCRRYAKANALVVLVTLTFDRAKCERPTDRTVAMGYGASFVRRLRKLGYVDGPYEVLPELHKDGEHYHLHVLLPLRRLHKGQHSYPKRILERAHPFGFVDVRQFKNRGRGNGSGVRAAASYAAKYVGKSYDDGHEGRHRYEVGQGFQPEAVRIEAPTLHEWTGVAVGVMDGETPASTWRSDSEWRGPPAVRLEWNEGR